MKRGAQSEFYWLAGLLEGEGSFLPGPPSAPNATRIQCCMCDEDVIRRVAAYFGTTYYESKRKSLNPRHRRSWVTMLKGPRARKLMQQLVPLMGERRQAQIRHALHSYDPTRSRIKLGPSEVRRIRQLLASGKLTHREIAAKFNIERSHVSHIKRGSTWSS